MPCAKTAEDELLTVARASRGYPLAAMPPGRYRSNVLRVPLSFEVGSLAVLFESPLGRSQEFFRKRMPSFELSTFGPP